MLGMSGVKFYNSSDIGIEMPQISIRYFHNMYPNMLVKSLIQSLNNRLIGKFVDGTGGAALAGVLTAPNGYEGSEYNIIDMNEATDRIKGSFLLDYAGRRFGNLLMTNYSVAVSTTKVLKYDSNWVPTPTSDPLYADISITLVPAVMYTANSLNRLFS